jgi:hypothetical protein
MSGFYPQLLLLLLLPIKPASTEHEAASRGESGAMPAREVDTGGSLFPDSFSVISGENVSLSPCGSKLACWGQLVTLD